jgi:beta-galactosidase
MTTSRRTFLKASLAGVSVSLAAAGTEARTAGPVGDHELISSNLHELLGKIRLGAEFFLNKTASEESVRKHFQLMQRYGITVVRIFVIWDDVERTPGVWTFERYDWIYDAARDSGIKIAATLCSEDPPGWAGLTPFYHHYTNLNDPKLREHAALYLEKVVTHYRNHPAHGVWLLMNEPHPVHFYDQPAMEAFGKWLGRKYGTVDKLNQRWFRPLKNFSDVKVEADQWNSSWVDYPSFVDWHEFNEDNLVELLKWIKDQVRKFDSAHPTHFNPTGGNRWKESRVVDFLGASIHPPWMFGEFQRKEFGLAFAYNIDLLASAAGKKPWWVTELEGGPTIYTGHRSLNPTRDELTLWLWDAFGAGCKGVVFWLWNPRVLGREAGEWEMVSLDGVPSSRTAVVKNVLADIGRMPFIAEAKPQQPKTAILYNRETLLLIELDGQIQHRTREGVHSLIGCYEALRRQHIPTTFIDIDQLNSGGASQYEVLYLPYCYAIDDRAVSMLKKFVSQGGTLWADGLLGWKNEYGEISPGLPGGLAEVFGWDSYVAEVDPVEEPYSITADDEQGGELWKIPLNLRGAQATIRDRRGKPFATEYAFGKGKAYYYGSALTLAYFKRANPEVEKWITAPAVRAESQSLVQPIRGPGLMGYRALHHPSGPIAVLTNWGPDDQVAVRFRGAYASITNHLAGSPVRVTRHEAFTEAELTLLSGKACVLKASKQPGTHTGR